MNFPHLHLILNHFPIIGTIIGLGLFLVSFVGKTGTCGAAPISSSQALLF